MANPWIKKNPLLSIANTAARRARGLWTQQAKRNQIVAVKQVARSWAELWTPTSGTKRRK
jgi:hypothetical protein